jgi:hypothetical protein
MSRRQSGFLASRSQWGPKTPRSLSLSMEVWKIMETLSVNTGLSYSELAERIFRRPDNAKFLEQFEATLAAASEEAVA